MSDPIKPNLTEQQSHWLTILKNCKASGQTMKAFVTSEGLDLQDLYTWKKMLVKKGVLPRTQKPRFQQVKIIDSVSVPECRINCFKPSYTKSPEPYHAAECDYH
ncbi:MAG: hypothetical protein GXP22_03690 [Gammaproteobacteria bacterium]|nr:hypothetical protein [Gammaproteobacteria bacterium]